MTMMKSIGLSTFVCLLGCILCNAAYVGYTVRTQEEFDAYIKKAQSGEPIEISLAKGNYVLKSKIIARATFSIDGNGATITYANDRYTCEDAVRRTPDHYICKLKNQIPVFSLSYISSGSSLLHTYDPYVRRTMCCARSSLYRSCAPVYISNVKSTTHKRGHSTKPKVE